MDLAFYPFDYQILVYNFRPLNDELEVIKPLLDLSHSLSFIRFSRFSAKVSMSKVSSDKLLSRLEWRSKKAIEFSQNVELPTFSLDSQIAYDQKVGFGQFAD